VQSQQRGNIVLMLARGLTLWELSGGQFLLDTDSFALWDPVHAIRVPFFL
jgi:hypothetical protein